MKKFDTFQEFMDWSVQKIVDQGGQCLGNDGECLYSDGKGKHCLIGWNLPEKLEYKRTQSLDVDSLIERFSDDCKHFSHFDVKALKAAQLFHDADSVLVRQKRLERMVNQYNLDPSPPQYQQWIDMGI